MRFGGIVSDGGGGMVSDGLCSYNIGTAAAAAVPVHSSMFNSSSPLSLALQPKMENLGGMGLIGESYDGGLLRTREDELDSRSGSDNLEVGSGDDGGGGSNNHNAVGSRSSNKRKKYHRHTAFQIQELENAFKENPHPDEKSRHVLGRRLGLEGRQIKFWFQNRRTQMKTQLERHENSILKQENDKLRMENIALKEAMRSPICENCGSPAMIGEIPIEHHHVMIENARLKDELNRLAILAGKFLSRNNSSASAMLCNSKLDAGIGQLGFSMLNSIDLGLPLGLEFGNRAATNAFPALPPCRPAVSMPKDDRSLFMELAMVAIDELIKLAQPDCPLWFRSTTEGSRESLNLEEYNRTFSPCIGVKPGHFVTEATRATGTVMINNAVLVESLMDVNQWMEMFPWNIAQASIIDVISPGMAGNRNGSLQLMQAEFQILSHMVPVRQVKFIRFCKQLGEDMMAVVDVSVDLLIHGNGGNTPVSCRRLPSGCIVQDMPDGRCKVTWIEHTEYDENMIHHLYRPLVMSGLAFGAQRWVASLQRQCELFASILSSVATGDEHLVIPPSGKKSIGKLAQRMSRSFCSSVCATVHKWEVVQNADNIKLMMRKSIGNAGEPPGIIISATTTVWMPVLPQHLFEFLQNEKTREHWDVLSQDGPMQQVMRISKGSQDNGNSICLLHTNVLETNANQRSVLILQDACTDASGSLIVHAAVDTAGMNAVMSGSDPSGVAMLPSGFAITPDCLPDSSRTINGEGSLLTVGFQILVNNLPAAKITMESVDTVKSLIARTLQGIKGSLRRS